VSALAATDCLQDTDSLVRDAACEALSAYAWALAEAAGSPLQGNSSCAVVKLIFECLAEQKKEAQLGASQALLMVRLGQLSRAPKSTCNCSCSQNSQPPGCYAACM
jgi:hypothetical protein